MNTTTAKAKAKAKAFFTAAEVAELAGVNVETVYRWARAEPPKIGFCPQLPGQRYYRFLQKHIDDFFNGVMPAEAAPKTAKPSRHPKYAARSN